MKNYIRKQISTEQLELYAKCPKMYELMDGIPSDGTGDTFNMCLKETILHMYIAELTSGHVTEFSTVKSFWDKTFWKHNSPQDATIALKLAEKGIDILYQYYTEIYDLNTCHVTAVKAPYDYVLNNEKIAVPVELDVILNDTVNKEIYLISLINHGDDTNGIRKHILSSLDCLIKMSSIKKESPEGFNVNATFYNISHNDIIGHTINIDQNMVDKIDKVIKYLSVGLTSKIYCPSKSLECDSCIHNKNCSL